MPIGKFLRGLISPVSDIVKEVVVDRDKQDELQTRLEETIMDYETTMEVELTKRLEFDMKSDSWLSKNVRPLSLVFLTSMFTIFAFTDGNIGQFSVNQAYIPVYQNLLVTVFTFYFGSRGLEKIAKIWKSPEETNAKNN
jgi:hypothetical protein